jgi:methylase of polypeptide subunit release factors
MMKNLFRDEVESSWAALAIALAGSAAKMPPRDAEARARRIVQLAIFLGLCQSRGVIPAGTVERLTARPGSGGRLADWLQSARQPIAAELWAVASPDGGGRSLDDVELLGQIAPGLLDPLLARLTGLAAAEHCLGGPIEILGAIHQRLSGRELSAAGRGRAKIRPAAGVRKLAGMFYTPAPVARYIAAHALRLLETGRPGRILDPACGCGAFLSAAAAHLRCGAAAVAEQLYGVDVDPEAVLIARRSLWLELLTADLGRGKGNLWGAARGHTPSPPAPLPERARGDTPPAPLPTSLRPVPRERGDAPRALARRLGENIRCGDALLGPTLADAAATFDVVLGNPPYRRELGAKPLLDRLAASELGRKYRTARMDLWYYFVHRGLELLKPGGRLAFIVGSYWTAAPGAAKLVRQLQRSAGIEEIVCFDGGSLFDEVAGRQMILSLRNAAAEGPTTIRRMRVDAVRVLADPTRMEEGSLVYEKTPRQLFRGGRIDLEPPADELLANLARHPPLEQLGRVRQGIAENPASVTRKTNQQHGDRWPLGQGVFALTAGELAALELPEAERSLLRPYHDLCDLSRYWMAAEPSLTLIYATAATCGEIDAFPVLRGHLERFRPILEARRETRRGCRAWWQLHWPRDADLWTAAKIIALQMSPRPAVAPALEPAYVPFSANVFVPAAGTPEHLYYLSALLNSRVLWKWQQHHAKRRGVGLEINGHALARTPIRRIDFADPADRRAHDRLVGLVTRMLDLNRQLRAASDQSRLRRMLHAVDRQIDAGVYRLYGLSAGEIAIVEAATPALTARARPTAALC